MIDQDFDYTGRKIYVRFKKPTSKNDDPPMLKMWVTKPDVKYADDQTFVYDETTENALVNERVWDGLE